MNAHRRALKAPLANPIQHGVGIVEVLVALVVISFGVLGIAGLQLSGMKQSTNGFNRAKAVMLAENMTERMWINRTGVASEFYDDFDSSTVDCNVRPATYCQAFNNNAAQRCDAEQLAAFDKFSVACGEWDGAGVSGGVAELLPAGSRLQVSCDDDPCTANSGYTLSVTWPERANASSDEALRDSRIVMRLRP